MEKNRRDLRPEAFPSLSWEPQEVAQSLETLYRYVEGEALKANDWYLRKKGPKRRLGQWLRGLAILLTAGAGLVPILSELWQIGRQPMIRPGWSPLLLGLAALFLLLDRFLGGTSSWMRYLAASQAIGDLLRRFRFDWTLQQAACAGQPPDAAHTERLIDLCIASRGRPLLGFRHLDPGGMPPRRPGERCAPHPPPSSLGHPLPG